MKPPVPQNELKRLKALQNYQLLDTLPEQSFDDLTKIASFICKTPVALISLVDKDRQWFKSKMGIVDSETSRDVAFCSYAINHPDQVMEIPNTLEDDRFRSNPFVVDDSSHFRYYAGAPLVNEEGYALGTICVLDTVPRKLSEEQLDALQALSRQVVNQMEHSLKIRQLKSSNQEIRKLSAEKGRFLGNMSHEIRTPLNAIIGSVHLLMDEPHNAAQQEYLNIMKFSSETLMALVNDILDMNKLEANKIKIEQYPLLLKELVQCVQAAHSVRAESKGIQLLAEIDPALPAIITGDAVRLAQILNNLVGNAVKFTDQGKVVIGLSLKEKTATSAKINFRVTDTGIGISKEAVGEIFSSYMQADTSITRRFGGTGLGLFITKNLIKLMNSKIQVTSELGVGSTFHFELNVPYSVDTEVTGSNPYIREIANTFQFEALSGNVLLVDDNSTNRIIVSRYLEKWGLKVITAANGQEAIDQIEQHRPDLVLMDLQMPLMDGYTAAVSVRKFDGNYFQQVPIIALTASALVDVRIQVDKCGMQDFIPKPFTPVELWSVLSKYLPKGEELAVAKNEAVSFQNETEGDVIMGLRVTMASLTEGDKDFQEILLDSFIQNFEELKEEASKALSESDRDNFDAVLHKIKPTCQMLGYHQDYAVMSDRLKQFESVDKKEVTQEILTISDRIIGDLKQVSSF